MADLSDVTASLAALIAAALYPPAAQPVFSTPSKVYEGWPNSTALDADMRSGTVHVTVFPMPGATAKVFQVLDNPKLLVPPVHGMTAAISGQTVTFSGTPTTGEYGSIVVDGRHAYSRVAASTSALVTALAADAIADYPTLTTLGSTITFPTAASIVARIGAPATYGQSVWRQQHQIMITIWAPSPATRKSFASFIDVLLKENETLTFADTSQGVMLYDRTNITDNRENALVFRRDLMFSVTYATVEQFTAYEITSVSSLGNPSNTDATLASVTTVS